MHTQGDSTQGCTRGDTRPRGCRRAQAAAFPGKPKRPPRHRRHAGAAPPGHIPPPPPRTPQSPHPHVPRCSAPGNSGPGFPAAGARRPLPGHCGHGGRCGRRKTRRGFPERVRALRSLPFSPSAARKGNFCPGFYCLVKVCYSDAGGEQTNGRAALAERLLPAGDGQTAEPARHLHLQPCPWGDGLGVPGAGGDPATWCRRCPRMGKGRMMGAGGFAPWTGGCACFPLLLGRGGQKATPARGRGAGMPAWMVWGLWEP